MKLHTVIMAAGIALAALVSHMPVNAQNLTENLDLNVNIANNHLWRGIEVSDGFVLTSSLSIHDKNDHIRLGVWSGTNTSGDYKELNYFAEFKAGGWKLAIWDTYNYSPNATYNNREFFNYSARTTGRFLDAILSYNAGKRFPLTLSWSTVVFGRDRNADNTANKYSTYIYAAYPVVNNSQWRIDLGCGGTFALNPAGDNSTFYSDGAGIIHTELRVSRNLRITKNYKLPIHASVVWNPKCDRAFFQLGATIL